VYGAAVLVAAGRQRIAASQVAVGCHSVKTRHNEGLRWSILSVQLFVFVKQTSIARFGVGDSGRRGPLAAVGTSGALGIGLCWSSAFLMFRIG
jgi:hypothetical protein